MLDESVSKAEYDRVVIEREQAIAEREEAIAERKHYHELYLKMLEQCKKLEIGLIGPKRERLSPSDAQLTMALLYTLLGDRTIEGVEAATDAALEEKIEIVREHVRRKPTGRKPLPENLPRVEIEIVPDEVKREGTDKFDAIGEEVAETVERRPSSLVVVRVRRPKFVRKDRKRNAETDVFTAAPPELPIERGLCGPAMLADTVVRRWQDHLPLYRLEQIYAREGLELARSTICQWHGELSVLCAPLVLAMWKDALASPYLCTDATGVLVQAKQKCKKGHFWVVIAPERHVLYAYSKNHDSDAVDDFLGDYQGYLVADAHAVYDHLYKEGVVEVGCWAHTRRYFFKALESDPERARQALALIGELFKIERLAGEMPSAKRRALRQRDSRPIVDRFFRWCDVEAEQVLDDTPISRGIGYALNQRTALEQFLDDGRLPLHNNASENALRREVVGRKNWLFLGNDEAGDTNATLVSLLASCQLHGIEPTTYLRDLFCLLPSWPARRALELAPLSWHQTFEQNDTQQLLAANIFRRASLGQSLEHQPNS